MGYIPFKQWSLCYNGRIQNPKSSNTYNRFRLKAYLGLHISVALFGLAGLFGRWLDLDPLWIVEGRVVFAFLSLALIIRIKGLGFSLDQKSHHLRLILIGAILAFHWYAFFRSIQETSIALALLSFASFPFWTMLLEAFGQGQRMGWPQWFMVLVSFSGTALIVPWDFGDANFYGVIWGLASGLSFALMAILNKEMVQSYPALKLSFFQDFWAALLLLPFCLMLPVALDGTEIALLALLGTLFTALSHSLFIGALKFVKARTAALIAALEPVYGIAAAYFLFSERLDLLTLIGGILILGTGVYAQFKDPALVED